MASTVVPSEVGAQYRVYQRVLDWLSNERLRSINIAERIWMSSVSVQVMGV